MSEYGLFNDEGMVEGQFASRAEAVTARDGRYQADDLAVYEVCPAHELEPLNGCEECAACHCGLCAS